ncbi:MAG: T9SS type A sorting domain-containing protein [Candidatus Helarchaeota archaeon]
MVFDPALILAYPNPSKNENIRFTEIETNTKVQIYSIGGTLIKTLGTGEHIWDLTNNSDKKVRSGVYIYYITNKGEVTYTGKMAIVR